MNPPEHAIAQPPLHQLAVGDLGHDVGLDPDDGAALGALACRRRRLPPVEGGIGNGPVRCAAPDEAPKVDLLAAQ